MSDQINNNAVKCEASSSSDSDGASRRKGDFSHAFSEKSEASSSSDSDGASRRKGDLSRAFSEDGALKTHVGGQALLEGIMMRGKYNWSVAVREPEGTIYTEEHDLSFGKDKTGWLYWPFVRGCRAFVESLALGYKALSIAAEHAFVEEDEEAEEGAYASAPAKAPEPASASEISSEQSSQLRKKTVLSEFGNPDEMIEGLGAQRTLEVIDADTGMPVRFVEDAKVDGHSNADIAETDGKKAIDDSAYAQGRNEGNCAEAAGSNAADSDISAEGHSVAAGTFASEGEDAESGPEAEDREEAFGSAASGEEPAATEPEKKPLLGDKEMAVSMILGLVLGIVLFIVAPAALTNLIVGEYDDKTLLWNVVDGILRIAVFVFYIWLIGRMSDIKRMFGYHGAEHKTIHCFEHGLPLTPENARSFPRLHVRCGTAFLIMVMIIAIFVYTITPIGALIGAWGVPDGPAKLALVIAVRILLMPLIAGVSYEITVKWAGSHPDNPLVKVILWPGMQMQYLTTREPDDGQIECAIAAMQLVLEREQREEAAVAPSA